MYIKQEYVCMYVCMNNIMKKKKEMKLYNLGTEIHRMHEVMRRKKK